MTPLTDLYTLARETLRLQGHDCRLWYKPTVLRLARTYVLDYELTESEVLHAFIAQFSATRVVEQRLTLDRPYKLDQRMRLAAQRSASQPTIIAVNSKKEIRNAKYL